MPTRRQRNFQGRNFKAVRQRDALTKRRRSMLMSRIRSSGSKMEAQFVAALKAASPRPFSLNDPGIFGKPDVAFREEKICVFLDSDFWHGWQYPRWRHLLKSDFGDGKLRQIGKGKLSRDPKTENARLEGIAYLGARFAGRHRKANNLHYQISFLRQTVTRGSIIE